MQKARGHRLSGSVFLACLCQGLSSWWTKAQPDHRGLSSRASILSKPRHHSALSGTARVRFPHTDTAGTHTKELLKLPPAGSTGEKVAPPRAQRQPSSVTTNLYKTQGLILHCSQPVPFVKVEPSPAS